MTVQKVVPYGHWQSPIAVETATAGTKSLHSPRTDPKTGRTFFFESKADGSSTILEVGRPGEEPRQVLPDYWSVGTAVYEYGGSAAAVISNPDSHSKRGPSIIFSNLADQSCRLLDVDSGSVVTVVDAKKHLRYGDFHSHPATPWILAIQEDHEHPKPSEVRNYVVGIHVITGEVVRIVEGADFYSYPRFSPNIEPNNGLRISWRQWDHPDLPFEGVTLHWAVWDPPDQHGHDYNEAPTPLTSRAVVAGVNRQCVGEYRWAPDGSLVFSMEKTGVNFRQLFRIRPGEAEPTPIVLKGLENVEFGDASWFLGCETFIFLSATTMVAIYTRLGQNGLVYANTETGVVTELDLGLVEIKFDPLAPVSESSFVVIGSGYTVPNSVYLVNLDLDSLQKARPTIVDMCRVGQSFATPTLIRRSTDQDFPPSVFSTPDLVCIPAPATATSPEHNVYGWFWPPHNNKFVAPPGTRPPLIVNPHGGPTGHSAPGLKMLAQYWATRGFAYFAINYGGSTGHGRAYRDSLLTRWGLLDCDDVKASIEYLTSDDNGRADPKRVGIEGGSAGGYNVLQSLVVYPDLFAGGISLCGVADTAALGRDTHKLESHYLEGLLWAPGTPFEERKRINWERSPLFHAAKITAPLLLIHGEEDPIVPIAQSKAIRDSIKERGGDVELLALPGEGHMFAKTESLVRSLKAETEWWAKTLLK